MASRNNTDSMGITNLCGFENVLSRIARNVSLSSPVSTNGYDSSGTREIPRGEAVTLCLAATVTQVLPNGNLVMVANQQARVNSELVSLSLSGVIRPQDISNTNTIEGNQIAEERISYGGAGQLTAVQAPSWGQQLLNIISPF